jgi:hypothetical protein
MLYNFIMVEEVHITNEEFLEYAMAFERHHAIFYKFWSLGRPRFDPKVKTASVSFDTEGKFLSFNFNPDFWKTLTKEQRLFVSAHECLHIINNHGIRIVELPNLELANIAADLVVNHSLVSKFDFDRTECDPKNIYCWVDTIFTDKSIDVKINGTFEYYYNLLVEQEQKNGKGKGKKGNKDDKGKPEKGEGGDSDKGQLVDSHNWNNSDELIDFLDENLDEEDKNFISEHLKKSDKNYYDAEKKGGHGVGELSWLFAEEKIPPKKKWETIINRWSKKQLLLMEKNTSQWIFKNRRFSLIGDSLMLPTDRDVDRIIPKKNRPDVFFYLDTSGSCWGLKDRFFKAAKSLNKDYFNINLFCFDTRVYPTTLASRQIFGGGGTHFNIMEEHIQSEMTTHDRPYPDAVFVITDGEGNHVYPEMPDRWHWFLTEMKKTYIPKTCKVFDLGDYE